MDIVRVNILRPDNFSNYLSIARRDCRIAQKQPFPQKEIAFDAKGTLLDCNYSPIPGTRELITAVCDLGFTNIEVFSGSLKDIHFAQTQLQGLPISVFRNTSSTNKEVIAAELGIPFLVEDILASRSSDILLHPLETPRSHLWRADIPLKIGFGEGGKYSDELISEFTGALLTVFNELISNLN